MGTGSHQAADCGLYLTDIVSASVAIVVKEFKFDVLSRLEDIIDLKGSGEVGVELVLNGLCLSWLTYGIPRMAYCFCVKSLL